MPALAQALAAAAALMITIGNKMKKKIKITTTTTTTELHCSSTHATTDAVVASGGVDGDDNEDVTVPLLLVKIICGKENDRT